MALATHRAHDYERKHGQYRKYLLRKERHKVKNQVSNWAKRIKFNFHMIKNKIDNSTGKIKNNT